MVSFSVIDDHYLIISLGVAELVIFHSVTSVFLLAGFFSPFFYLVTLIMVCTRKRKSLILLIINFQSKEPVW